MRRRWRVDDDGRHHLLDPRTGEPAASGIRSSTVLAPTCRVAEVAAKVALLLGRDAGKEFLEARGLSGVLVGEDGVALPVGRWRFDGPQGSSDAVSPGAVEGWFT